MSFVCATVSECNKVYNSLDQATYQCTNIKSIHKNLAKCPQGADAGGATFIEPLFPQPDPQPGIKQSLKKKLSCCTTAVMTGPKTNLQP